MLGRTDLELFDPNRAEPALLQPGDCLKFVPANHLLSNKFIPHAVDAPAGFEVLESGVLTTVQDCGRPGFQKIGISPGGAADPVAARVANLLVGNPDKAALLECCVSGPVLRFLRAVRAAWVGWADARCGRPVDLTAGELLDLRGRMASSYGYLAIAGGIDVPEVLGSRATDLRAGFGGWQGRGLRAGDRLPLGKPQPGPPPGAWRVGWPRTEMVDGALELRFLKGMQSTWFTDDALETFRESIYQLSPFFDRMGARLDGPLLERAGAGELISQPVVAGSVQVPPDGRPIVLLAERQTIGGYPQIGHVISADVPKLARALTGTRLRFREVSLDEARAAWIEARREEALLHAGLDLIDCLFYAPPAGALAAAAKMAGLRLRAEGFADRRYTESGELVPRGKAGAMIEEVGEAVAQAMQIASKGRVQTTAGTWFPLPAQTFCVHGDSLHALEILRAVRQALIAVGIKVQAQ